MTLRNLTTPTLNEQLTMQCEATVTRGVTSPVDIIWSRNNGTEMLQRVDGANSTLRGDMLVLTDIYTTPVLTENDNGMMYTCTVSIITTPDRRSGNDFFILALHSKYKMYHMHMSSMYLSFSCYHCYHVVVTMLLLLLLFTCIHFCFLTFCYKS